MGPIGSGGWGRPPAHPGPGLRRAAPPEPAQLVIEAATEEAAVEAGVAALEEAARKAGLPEWPVARAEVISEDDDWVDG